MCTMKANDQWFNGYFLWLQRGYGFYSLRVDASHTYEATAIDEGIRFRYLLPIIGNRQDFNLICVLAANGFANSSWSSLKSVKCIELGPEFSLNSPNDVNKGTVADLLNVSCGLVVKV